MNPALVDLLINMRQHPAFQDFLTALPPVAVPRFKRGKAVSEPAQVQQWIYDSGRAEQRDAMLRFLTGDPDTNLTENGETRNG